MLNASLGGNYGMGQAQSMSLGGIGCEDCPKYASENTPDRYIQLSGTINTNINYGKIPIPRIKAEISDTTI